MNELVLIFVLLAAAVVGFLFGRWSKSLNVLTLWDTFTPKTWRSEEQTKQDAVLKLQNELAKSGAVKLYKHYDGSIDVTLKVLL